MSENNCSEYFEDKGAKPSVTSLVNLMNKTAKAGSSRSSSPTSISSKNELNDNKRTLSSSSLASSVSVSSSSNLFKNNNQTSDYVEDSSIGVFDESTGSKCLNKLSQVCRSNRSSISTSTTNNLDDFNDEHLLMPNYNDDSAICNFTKLKAKKEDNQLATMMNKCQKWIETVTNKKFTYTNDFRKSLENGVILCELLNILKPDCIRRINRHSTPIAGIDNLNQFLKACQEHFGLSQANLFDITDLEDLVKRRGTISNNFSAKNENPNLNHHSIDQEQQRRLKKVVHTISWLCQNATKSGIPLPFNLDPCTFHTAQPSANLKQKSKILSYSSNTSLNQFSSSSVSSSLSSSSSFIQSTNNSGVSLSVIIGPGDSIKLSTPKSNCPLKQPNEGKEIACSSSSSCSDDISQYKLECIEYCGPKIELKQTMMSSTKTSIKADSNHLVSSASSMQSDGEAKHQQFPLIDSQCSPISTAHCAVSPRYVDTSSGRGTPNIPTPTSTTAAIPTRFFDRRVSSSAKEANPYRFNVNYSTAGQQLAKKAHEQLKTVEKSKELSGEKSDVATVPRRKSDYINHDDESLNDDWQNKVDDWKKRRREKQKLPQKPRCYEEELLNSRAERLKRINPFENSQHYILPLGETDEQKKCAMTIEVSAKKPTETTNEEPDQSMNESQSELDDSQNQQYVYTETRVEIDRPLDYPFRGFGFLLNSGLNNKESSEPIQVLVSSEIVLVNKCYAQIVVVEPNTLADRAGLKKGDLVTEINESCTNNLNNEQLRKLMRQRLQLNSISMKVLSQQRQGQEFENLSGDKTEPRSHSELPTALSPCSSDHSTPTISSITSNPLLNQHKQGDYHQIVAPKPFKKTYPTSNQTEDMNTESLIEKRKNQLNLILNWTLNANTVIAEIISPDSSKSTSIDDLAIENNQAESSSLSPVYDQKNSLDSLSESKKSNESETKSDDTDHDNDDDDLLHSPSPPPVPTTEPPPLPSNKSENPSLQIKKALMDNMKSIESWKQEQEELMKRKYDEEQKRIELSLKLDLNRVKEEEIQRREQERLKLEKEKIRLQELEIKQREEELKKNLEENTTRLTLPASHETFEQSSESSPNSPVQETIRKQDLNALIEKIYTEENQECEFPKFELAKPEPYRPLRPNQPQKIAPQSLIQAKTASLAMSIGNHEEKNLLPSLIDTNTKHQMIKQVHDSMDFLNNELLAKGMTTYAHQVDQIHQNLNQTCPKQDHIDQIRFEQDTIKMEKQRIEQEKEKLRFEAENLRQEREMMLMAGPVLSLPTNDFNLFKTNMQAEIRPTNSSAQPGRKHINVVNKNHVPMNRFDDAHKTVKVANLKNTPIFEQKMRRSVPSLASEPRFVNHIVAPMTIARKNPVPQRMMTSRPSNSYQQISQSQKALNQPQNLHNSANNIQTISLNQKCSGCSQTLGQGSAMWIEKLGLAFHLKCFRCSVCSVALGNGKEGTDVRVSGANRLHCNNCFSNDLGLRLSAV